MVIIIARVMGGCWGGKFAGGPDGGQVAWGEGVGQLAGEAGGVCCYGVVCACRGEGYASIYLGIWGLSLNRLCI